MDSFLELEESIAGMPGGRWVTPSNNTQLSLLAISLALACGLFGGMWEGFLPNGFFELVAKAEAEGAGSLYFSFTIDVLIRTTTLDFTLPKLSLIHI